MKQVTRHCDRCGQNILEGGAIVDVQAGGMVRQYPEALDLCKECSERFADWLRSGHQANHSGPGGAISSTAVLGLWPWPDRASGAILRGWTE